MGSPNNVRKIKQIVDSAFAILIRNPSQTSRAFR